MHFLFCLRAGGVIGRGLAFTGLEEERFKRLKAAGVAVAGLMLLGLSLTAMLDTGGVVGRACVVPLPGMLAGAAVAIGLGLAVPCRTTGPRLAATGLAAAGMLVMEVNLAAVCPSAGRDPTSRTPGSGVEGREPPPTSVAARLVPTAIRTP